MYTGSARHVQADGSQVECQRYQRLTDGRQRCRSAEGAGDALDCPSSGVHLLINRIHPTALVSAANNSKSEFCRRTICWFGLLFLL